MKLPYSPIVLVAVLTLTLQGCSGPDGNAAVPLPVATNSTGQKIDSNTVAAAPSPAASPASTDPGNPQMPQLASTSSYSYKVVETTDSTGQKLGWGYELYVDSTRYIRQRFIPAIQGNKAFSSAAEAKRLAELSVLRMKKYNTFPTTSVHDLDSLKIAH